MFKIIYKEDISINELKSLSKKNYSILRSAHVGNFNKQTLMLLQEGYNIVLHEHLRGNAKIYEPAYVKTRNKKIKISNNSDDFLQLHDNEINIQKDKYCKPSQFHYQKLKQVFDKSNLELASNLLLKQKAFLMKVLEILIKYFPEQLYKYEDKEGNSYLLEDVLPDGTLKYKCYDIYKYIEPKDVIDEIINQLIQTREALIPNSKINPEGIVINSKLYILLFSISEIYKGRIGINRFKENNVDIYHFSGTQMINYLYKNEEMADENIKFFNEAYEFLYKTFSDILPRDISFNLVPTDALQYVGCIKENKYKNIDEIFQLYNEIKSLENEKKNIVDSNLKSFVKKLEHMTNEEMLLLLNNIEKTPKLKKLIIDKEHNRKKIIGEIVNIYKITGKLNNECIEYTEKLNKMLIKMNIALKQKIKNNLALFYEDITQYDLLERNSKIYISPYANNMKFNEIMKLAKIIKNCKQEESNLCTEKHEEELPFKLAPVQVKILPIMDEQNKYCNQIKEKLIKLGVRIEIDERNKKIGYKIRQAQLDKIPYMLIIGKKEEEESLLSVRSKKDGDIGVMSLKEFQEKIIKEIID